MAKTNRNVGNTEHLKRGMILTLSTYTDHSSAVGKPVNPCVQNMRIRKILGPTTVEVTPVPWWLRAKWSIQRFWYGTDAV